MSKGMITTKRLAVAVPLLALVLALQPASALANSLQVDAASAMSGSFGMRVNYDGAPSNAYVQSADRGTNPHPWSNETAIRIRFLLDPGNSSSPPGDMMLDQDPLGNIRVIQLYQDWIVNGVKVVLFVKRGASDDAWRFACYVRQDDDNNSGSFVFGGEAFLTGDVVSTSETIVEFEWGAASAPGANDGFVRATKQPNFPGAPVQTIFERTDLDNDTHMLNISWFGSTSTTEVGTTEGNLYFDDVSITRLP